MTGNRGRAYVLGVFTCLAMMLSGAGSAEADRTAPPPPASQDWYECLHNSDVPNSKVVDKYTHGAFLNCGGARHIKRAHGFDSYTLGCISKVVSGGVKKTSKSNPLNWRYLNAGPLTDLETGESFIKGYVIVNKSNGSIVSAYVDPDDHWNYCVAANMR